MTSCPVCNGSLELTDTLQHNWGVYTCEYCNLETQGEIILADILDDTRSE